MGNFVGQWCRKADCLYVLDWRQNCLQYRIQDDEATGSEGGRFGSQSAMKGMVGRASRAAAVAGKGVREANLPKVIADQLRELITRGTLPPGLQLRQMELAERFNASRVPLREALKLLSAEGIVEHDPNRGFFVAPLSANEARQLYRIRHLLESDLLSTVGWPSAAQLSDLRKRLKGLEEALKAQDAAAWLAHHREFYRLIFALSPEKVLVAEVLRLISLTDRYRALAAHALPSAHRKATQERHLISLLAKRDRKRLMAVFEADRTRIDQGIQAVLQARGL